MHLERYFERIGYQGEARPELATLRQIHALHPVAIPFENLSTLIGEPVRLDMASLQEKLIERGRGGYCFEQNSLLQHALETIGFELTPLAARVIWNPDHAEDNPRTHMALLVTAEGEQFLCDVGFGGVTLTSPLPFRIGQELPTPHETYRIMPGQEVFELQVQLDNQWRPVYQFDLQPQRAIDYQAMSHYVETHPSSHFRSVLMAARPDQHGRYSLGGKCLTRYEGGIRTKQRELSSADELRGVLSEEFRIRLPDEPELDVQLARIAATSPI